MVVFDFTGKVFDESQQCLFVFLPAIDNAISVLFRAKYKSLSLTRKKRYRKNKKEKRLIPIFTLHTHGWKIQKSGTIGMRQTSFWWTKSCAIANTFYLSQSLQNGAPNQAHRTPPKRCCQQKVRTRRGIAGSHRTSYLWSQTTPLLYLLLHPPAWGWRKKVVRI